MSHIDVVVDSTPGAVISPDLWGIFLEDLNYALDGGLSAELIMNGDFEYTEADARSWGPLAGWSVSTSSLLRTVTPRSEDPLHPNNATYLRIEGPTILRNEGWDGIGVVTGERFRLRFAARRVLGAGALLARIATADRAIAQAAPLPAIASKWEWVDLDLTGIEDARGTFELHVPSGLVIDLDAVSIRPLSAAGEPEIFRPDIMAALAELKPSFVRFPGGCLAHGVGLDNIYDWKGSIGPTHTRRQLANPWGYHQSRAVGYLEFFLLCERLGATAVPVVAAGVCCQNTPGGPRSVPLAQMPNYIADILDLIEFARGGADTTWGSRRAELGHPNPFSLRYLGVGNEDEITADFRDRYAQIEDAVRRAHADIVVIGTTGPASAGRDFDLGWTFARERGTALVDEHYYEAPFWFHQNLDRYDDYDRSGPGVYLGEYAARSNRVRSALAEAAYMIGLERNSDVVRLASYAPLLARIGNTQWDPDLIYFDAERVLPSASYFVQQMFSNERGSTTHAVRGEVGGKMPVSLLARGDISVTAQSGRFGFSNIRLNGSERSDLLLEPFSTLHLGTGDLLETELKFQVTRLGGDAGFVIDFGTDGPDLAYTVEISAWRNDHTTVKLRQFGVSGDATDGRSWRGFAPQIPVQVRIRITSGRFQVWLDDHLVHNLVAPLRPEHRIAVGAASRPGGDGIEYVLRLVNATDQTVPARVSLENYLPLAARATILTGAGPDQGAAFEHSPISPAALDVKIIDGRVQTELSPWSFAVVVVS